MADDDDYVEGNAESAPADAPGEIPADDKPKGDTIDSVATHDAPEILAHRGRATARTVQARKAFAEAVLASKAKPVEVKEDLEDPEDVALAAADPKPAPTPSPSSPTETKPVETKPVEPVVIATPPAPSLDPEVLRLRQQLKAELEQAQAKNAEVKPKEPEPVDVSSLEEYLDNAPRAYRTWLETMRGEKFASDEEFKSEAADFITQMSSDVMGVPLPEGVRSKLDSALARKTVKTHRTLQAKREAAARERADRERAEAAAKAETERVEHEWTQAGHVLSKLFAPEAADKPSATATTYPWLAAEDEPGKIIVDVIRSAQAKDGTNLSWQEASKKANDYLETQAKRYYDKRKPLLGATPAVRPDVAAAAKPAAAPVAKPAAAPVEAAKPAKKWSKDSHMEQTKAAFRQMLNNKPA